MNTQSKTKAYMLTVMAVGFSCLAYALLNLSYQKLDVYFLLIFGFNICIG